VICSLTLAGRQELNYVRKLLKKSWTHIMDEEKTEEELLREAELEEMIIEEEYNERLWEHVMSRYDEGGFNDGF
jgi:hypothetical protein